jgi:opacity protein-like surface antigen
MYKKIAILVLGLSAQAAAYSNTAVLSHHGFYAGVLTGYASTTWKGLVGSDLPSLVSTPATAKEGGIEWGGLVGYQFNRGFSVELDYLNLPKASMTFNPISVYVVDDNVTAMNSSTQAIALSTKIFAPMGVRWRLFGKVGVEATHRTDDITGVNNPSLPHSNTLAHFRWRVGAIFGVGFSYDINSHWMTQFGFDYLTGYGESNHYPVYTYTPFIYAGYINLAYHYSM